MQQGALPHKLSSAVGEWHLLASRVQLSLAESKIYGDRERLYRLEAEKYQINHHLLRRLVAGWRFIEQLNLADPDLAAALPNMEFSVVEIISRLYAIDPKIAKAAAKRFGAGNHSAREFVAESQKYLRQKGGTASRPNREWYLQALSQITGFLKETNEKCNLVWAARNWSTDVTGQKSDSAVPGLLSRLDYLPGISMVFAIDNSEFTVVVVKAPAVSEEHPSRTTTQLFTLLGICSLGYRVLLATPDSAHSEFAHQFLQKIEMRDQVHVLMLDVD